MLTKAYVGEIWYCLRKHGTIASMDAYVSYDGEQDDQEKEPGSTGAGGDAQQETDAGTAEGNRPESSPGPVGTIYILETQDQKLIKIGFTTRLSMRLAQHALFIRKTGGEVRMIGFFPGTIFTEGRLHHYFADCRYKNEWYHREPALARLARLFDKPLAIAERELPAKSLNPAAVALGKRSAKGRMSKLTPEQRSAIARKAGLAGGRGRKKA